MKTPNKDSRSIYLSVMVALTVSLCTSAYAGQTDTDAALTNKLSKLEERYFERDYQLDSDDTRVARLERFVYGEPQSGSLQSRIKILDGVANEYRAKKTAPRLSPKPAPAAASTPTQPPQSTEAPQAVGVTQTAEVSQTAEAPQATQTPQAAQDPQTAQDPRVAQDQQVAQDSQVAQDPQALAHFQAMNTKVALGMPSLGTPSLVPAAPANPPAIEATTPNEVGASSSAEKPEKPNSTLSKTVAAKQKSRKQSPADKALDDMLSGMPDDSQDSALIKLKLPLHAEATYVDLSPQFSNTIHKFTKIALDRTPEYENTAKAVDHFRTKTQRTIQFTKDAMNYAMPYRGFSMSMEGSRVILDKNQKPTNLWLAELAKQRYWDEMHPQIMAQLMQIATGLGMQNQDQANIAIQKGYKGLSDLIGEETAKSTLDELTEWKAQLKVPDEVFQQTAWDTEQSQKVYQDALKTSATGDPLIHYVYDRVKKYDHGKLANFTASMVESSLAAITIMSGNPFASLASEGISTAFVMSTGGPEENKILKELYYGRRLEIRRKRISDETQLGLSNYEKALLTHNSTQLAMSEIVLSELVGSDKLPTLLNRDPINDFISSAPIELAQKDSK